MIRTLSLSAAALALAVSAASAEVKTDEAETDRISPETGKPVDTGSPAGFTLDVPGSFVLAQVQDENVIDPVPATAVDEDENTIDTPTDVKEIVGETDTDRLQPQANDVIQTPRVVGTVGGAVDATVDTATGAVDATVDAVTPGTDGAVVVTDEDPNTIDTQGDEQELVEETDTDRVNPVTGTN